ncbi:MAG: glycosyltransferase family 2 protein [Acidimicrobiales bacterium]
MACDRGSNPLKCAYRISVVVATYNGERWLDEQLSSVAYQTRTPDEIIVTDDGSTDRTVEIARTVLRGSGIPNTILEHRDRLGPTGNFQRGIRLASGEAIALADQDDLWEPWKLVVMENALRAAAVPSAVFSDATLVDPRGIPTGSSLWETLGLAPTERRHIVGGEVLPSLLRRNLVTGATLAFDSSLCTRILPFPEVGLHDFWIAWLLAATQQVFALDQKLVRYRVHGSNVIGVRPRPARKQVAQRFARAGPELAAEAQMLDAVVERLERLGDVSREVVEVISAKADHQRFRANLPEGMWNRAVQVGSRLRRGTYRTYSDRPFLSATLDMGHRAVGT